MARRRKAGYSAAVIASAALILLVAVAMGWAIYASISGSAGVDKTTGCLTDSSLSPEQWVVVVDVTSPLTSQEKTALEGLIDKITRSAKATSRLRLYRLGESAIQASDRVVDICSPGNPDEADPLKEYVEDVKRKWDQKFRATVLSELSRITTTSGLRQSPIIESINYVSLLEFGRPLGHKKHLIVVSDLLQNSNALNMYIDQPNFDSFRRAVGDPAVSARLEGVSVQLLYLSSSQPSLQRDAWTRFWAAYVVSNGGLLVGNEIKPIEKF
jgi:hypothetical protein